MARPQIRKKKKRYSIRRVVPKGALLRKKTGWNEQPVDGEGGNSGVCNKEKTKKGPVAEGAWFV